MHLLHDENGNLVPHGGMISLKMHAIMRKVNIWYF